MNAEKISDVKVCTMAERNTESIIKHLNEYLSIRFDMASRINPRLRPIKEDLMYHETASIRRCLLGDKIYGVSRMKVADVFLSDNDKNRRNLMSPTDQTSIQVELVSHCQDERVEATRGQIRIHDLKSFYSSIDHSLLDMMDLYEAWIWWDILDAAELTRFEQKLGVLTLVGKGKLTEEMRKRYVALISAGEDEHASHTVTDEDIIRFEMKQLLDMREHWSTRRQYEMGYMFVLRRDELPAPDQGELIHIIAESVREYDAIAAEGGFTDEIKQRYAQELRVVPEKVTREMVLDSIKQRMLEQERGMAASMDDAMRLGPPYNYKRKQLEQMDRWLQDLQRQYKTLLEKEPAPEEARAAQGAASAPAKEPAPHAARSMFPGAGSDEY